MQAMLSQTLREENLGKPSKVTHFWAAGFWRSCLSLLGGLCLIYSNWQSAFVSSVFSLIFSREISYADVYSACSFELKCAFKRRISDSQVHVFVYYQAPRDQKFFLCCPLTCVARSQVPPLFLVIRRLFAYLCYFEDFCATYLYPCYWKFFCAICYTLKIFVLK
jgi:hypothetical protein